MKLKWNHPALRISTVAGNVERGDADPGFETGRVQGRTPCGPVKSDFGATFADWNQSVESASSMFLRRLNGSQQLPRVLFENQWTNFFTNRRLFQIGDPAIRGNQRIIRTKQYLVLQKRIGILHQLRREIFG